MSLKNRYRRIRYTWSWKYPTLYNGLCKIAFPAQVLALCFALAGVVNLYQKHYSFEATSRSSKAALNTEYIHPLARNNATGNSPPRVTVSTDGNVDSTVQAAAPATDSAELVKASLSLTPDTTSDTVKTTTADIQKSSTSLSSEEDLRAQILRAETKEKRQQTQLLKAKVERARNRPASPEPTHNPERITATPETNEPTQNFYAENWLQELPSSHFVIQIASSTNYDLLADHATNWSVNAPLIIYPSTVSEKGNVIYGLSSGLYNSKKDAVTEIPLLKKISKQDDVWVRQVSEMKSKLASLRSSRLIQ